VLGKRARRCRCRRPPSPFSGGQRPTVAAGLWLLSLLWTGTVQQPSCQCRQGKEVYPIAMELPHRFKVAFSIPLATSREKPDCEYSAAASEREERSTRVRRRQGGQPAIILEQWEHLFNAAMERRGCPHPTVSARQPGRVATATAGDRGTHGCSGCNAMAGGGDGDDCVCVCVCVCGWGGVDVQWRLVACVPVAEGH
jgi:hypothetical protein